MKIPSGQLNQLRRVARRYESGQTLAAKGDASSEMFLLLSGSVEIWRDDELVELVADPGHFFGHFAYFTGGERNATMKVRDAAEIVRIRPESVTGLLENAPSLAVRMVSDTSKLFIEREDTHAGLREAREPDGVTAVLDRFLPVLALALLNPLPAKSAAEILSAFRMCLRMAGVPTGSLKLGDEFVPEEIITPEARKALLAAKDEALEAKRTASSTHPFHELLQDLRFEY